MILIFSKNEDVSTGVVIDWLNTMGEESCRINIMSLENEPNKRFSFAIGNSEVTESFFFNGKNISPSNIQSVWMRRKGTSFDIDTSDPKTSTFVRDNLKQEQETVASYYFNKLKHCNWLNHPETTHLNKLIQLETAVKCGIKIPETFITNSKTDLLLFLNENEDYIIKALSTPFNIELSETEKYTCFTTKMDKDFLDTLPDSFFPCLVQKNIKKKFELRCFFLDNTFYSMAIFSQRSERSKIDFRNYDHNEPNRTVPFTLPEAITNKLISFMNLVGLNSGSVDLIYTEDNEYCFLEVNPVGQFGMVSYPCNYYLEKKIANYLIKNHANN